jgi:RNA polymerase sigma-54 factor
MIKKYPTLQNRHEVRQYLLPTLTYYLRLLELPNLELETIIRQALEENQVLEEVPQDEETPPEETPAIGDKTGDTRKEKDDFSILEVFSEASTVSAEPLDDEFDPLDNAPADSDPLYSHLQRQAERKFTGRDLEIAELIISNIEEDGYLAASPEEMVQEDCDVGDINRIIKEIQRFDPVGCAWRDIKEPLLAQLEAGGYAPDSIECMLVRDHLGELKHNHVSSLINSLNISEEQYLKAKKAILKLNPCPGLQYSGAMPKYVLPDFIITWQDNHLIGHLNDNDSSRIRVKTYYLDMLKNKANLKPEEYEFIKKKAQSAQNLIIAIEQRRKTLHKIVNQLLEYQRDFFERGPGNMRPITMTEFAGMLNVNPSTISRAIANKYLESPWGIHKMKYFFSAPVAKTDKRLIHEKIKNIVAQEDNSAPLSDAQIAKKLSREGIILSRRTVTKYRELLNIQAQQFRRKI